MITLAAWQILLMLASAVLFGLSVGSQLQSRHDQRETERAVDQALSDHEAALREAEETELRSRTREVMLNGLPFLSYWPITAAITRQRFEQIVRETAMDVEIEQLLRAES